MSKLLISMEMTFHKKKHKKSNLGFKSQLPGKQMTITIRLSYDLNTHIDFIVLFNLLVISLKRIPTPGSK